MQQDVLERRAAGQWPPVERDAVVLGVRLGARLEPDLAVDGDASFGEQPLSCSP